MVSFFRAPKLWVFLSASLLKPQKRGTLKFRQVAAVVLQCFTPSLPYDKAPNAATKTVDRAGNQSRLKSCLWLRSISTPTGENWKA